MVRYGKIAEKALRDLREKGFCDRQVPIATRAHEFSNGWVNIATFPAFVDVSRKDVPGYGDFRVSFGQTVRGEHGGCPTTEVRIHLHATAWSQHDDSWKPRGLHVGNARLKRNGEVVFVSNRSEGIDREAVSKLYGRADSPESREAHLNIGNAVAHHLVRVYKEKDVSQPMIDLRQKIGAWLVEDGYVRTICQVVRSGAKVALVLHS